MDSKIKIAKLIAPLAKIFRENDGIGSYKDKKDQYQKKAIDFILFLEIENDIIEKRFALSKLFQFSFQYI